MSVSRNIALSAAAALILAATGAHAAPLAIVNVAAPAINCVFNPSCSVVVTDSIGRIPNTAPTSLGRLQSRTFSGAPGAPGAGLTGYMYRVDLTSVAGSTAPLCVSAYKIDFGPMASLRYSANGPPAQVFVVTSGGLGTVGLAGADLTGTVVTFTFARPVCAGQTSYFFGMAAAPTPVPTDAAILLPGGWTNVDARSAHP